MKTFEEARDAAQVVERTLRGRYPDLFARFDRAFALTGIAPPPWIVTPSHDTDCGGVDLHLALAYGVVIVHIHCEDDDDAELARSLKDSVAEAWEAEAMARKLMGDPEPTKH